MSLLAVPAAIAALCVYVWIAAYVWHLLPDDRGWWGMPAFLTTAVLGITVYIGTTVYVMWLCDQSRTRRTTSG